MASSGGILSLGWVRVMRSVRREPWWRDVNARALWIELVLEAAWEPRTVEVRGHQLDLEPGQLVTSRQELSQLTGLSEQQVRTAMAKLEATKSVTKQATKLGTVITVENYEVMTGSLAPLRPVPNQASNPLTIRKNEDQEDQDPPPPGRPEPDFPDWVWKFADYLRDAIVEVNPTHSLSSDKGHGAWTKARRQKWAKELDRMFRLDGTRPAIDGDVEPNGTMVKGRPRRRTKDLIDWLYREDQEGMGEARFVVESAASLRKKWDRINTAYERAMRAPESGDDERWVVRG